LKKSILIVCSALFVLTSYNAMANKEHIMKPMMNQTHSAMNDEYMV